MSYNNNSGSVINHIQNYWRTAGDKRTTHMPGIGDGPWVMIIVLFIYTLFVTKLGPKFMQNRKPFELRAPMLIYNVFMVIINLHFFIESLQWLDYGRQIVNFKYPDERDTSKKTKLFISSFYLYWLTKFVDLLDTVFFVLRKKNNQITALHVYHHISVPIIGWTYIWYRFGAPSISLFALLNSICHVIMYSYYALASFGPKIQKYLWWKKYITMIQLGQFVIIFIYACFLLMFHQDYPLLYIALPTVQAPLFFILFFNFYNLSYKQKKVL